MSEHRLDLMDLFRRDMGSLEVTTAHHDDNSHPSFKRDPLTFKYEHSTYLFKVWMAGRNSAGIHKHDQ
ncbi:hypothetical protein HU742_018315 [Pseudomonas sp. SWRI102]|uniref:Uncharacterized protein n=1 Tax=Pseudomonas marvdashtae TaxID=2745500 RepID=A0A923FP11_9PSED|nr:hypothetical protein [Pseudomonas marvdashtae]MBV4553103.1 hypothetical protein [Pseudomonas marvdashtae]